MDIILLLALFNNFDETLFRPIIVVIGLCNKLFEAVINVALLQLGSAFRKL